MNQLRTGAMRKVSGFTLVELMVAMVAGLIVVGAVLTFTVSSIRSNSDFVNSTRLMQELRNSSDFITSDLKRAGYDETAMLYVANQNSTAVSRFAPILFDTTTADANCIIYAYDRQPGTPGAIDLSNGEIRGIRRKTATVGGQTVGVIEVAESTATATPACAGAQPDYSAYPTVCNTTSGWCPLSDPRTVDIQTFTVDTDGSGIDSNGVRTIAGGSAFNAIQLREIQLTLAGSLRNDASAVRSVRANIKVRADCVRANLAGCNVAPAP